MELIGQQTTCVNLQPNLAGLLVELPSRHTDWQISCSQNSNATYCKYCFTDHPELINEPVQKYEGKIPMSHCDCICNKIKDKKLYLEYLNRQKEIKNSLDAINKNLSEAIERNSIAQYKCYEAKRNVLDAQKNYDMRCKEYCSEYQKLTIFTDLRTTMEQQLNDIAESLESIKL